MQHPLRTILLLGLAFTACQGKKPPAKAPLMAEKPAKKAEAPKPKPKSTAKVVFDPKNPPAGYTNCHRNHCHKVGGGVSSYKQVMDEMGATEIIGGIKPKPMPPAPADVADPPADVQWTDSGLATKLVKAGDGKAKPTLTSTVTAHYTGWTRDGKGFDSSIARGKPATFPLTRMFPGLKEGIQMMTVGEERRFWIPENLAFQGRRPKGMVVFDVELISFK